MDNYYEVLKIAKELKDDYQKLSDFETLQIAAQIQIANVLQSGLLITHSETPQPLEAIAMALGIKPGSF